jgi:hypothetical protein
MFINVYWAEMLMGERDGNDETLGAVRLKSVEGVKPG